MYIGNISTCDPIVRFMKGKLISTKYSSSSKSISAGKNLKLCEVTSSLTASAQTPNLPIGVANLAAVVIAAPMSEDTEDGPMKYMRLRLRLVGFTRAGQGVA